MGEASQTVGLIYLIYAMAQMRQRRVTQKIAIKRELLVRFGRVKDGLEGDSARSVHTKKREERRRIERARKKTKLRVQQVSQKCGLQLRANDKGNGAAIWWKGRSQGVLQVCETARETNHRKGRYGWCNCKKLGRVD